MNGRSRVELFLVMVLVCQLALLVPAMGPYRMVLRMASFGMSVAMLAATFGREATPHPAAKPLLAVLAVAGLSLLHPSTNGWLSGGAQLFLYAAIAGPLFWVCRMRVDGETLRLTLAVLWLFHLTSSGLALVQVKYPGEFQPRISAVILAQGDEYLRDLHFRNAAGDLVLRPMGLTDIPGGASLSGFYAVLGGIGAMLGASNFWLRAAGAGALPLGMAAIYFSQTRSVLVMLVASLAALMAILAWRRQAGRLAFAAGAGAAALSFAWAVSIGGDAIENRFSSLWSEGAADIVYKGRGRFLEETILDLIPKYPFGAGMGRWGMPFAYLGDSTDPSRGALWAEIQWSGWLYDGGVPMIVVYTLAILTAAWIAARVAAKAQGELAVWAAVIVAYDAGAIAVLFGYPLFAGQSGMEFWLLNGVLFAATLETQRSAARDWMEGRTT